MLEDIGYATTLVAYFNGPEERLFFQAPQEPTDSS